jgi:hypothetical protein
MVFTIYENPADAVSYVVCPVVFEGIGKKIEYMDDTAIGAALVLPDITAFHDQMIAWYLKNIGMHEEDQDIGSKLELEFKCAFVVIFKKNGVGGFSHSS